MDYRPIKRIFYGLRGCISEIVSFIAWTLIGFIAFKYYSTPYLNFFLYILVLAAAHIILVLIRGKDANFIYFPFISWKEHANWMGNGNFEYVKSAAAFRITESHNGFIYSKAINWVNYKLSFQFKIVHQSVGIIFRAVDLSNYIMFQIFEDRVKPHIKVNGLWVFFDPKRPANIPFVELVPIAPKLSKDRWYMFKATCDKSLITICLMEDDSRLLDRTWAIPEGNVLFPLMLEPKPADVPFSMNLDYGTFGVRNDGSEMAFIRDLLVEKI